MDLLCATHISSYQALLPHAFDKYPEVFMKIKFNKKIKAIIISNLQLILLKKNLDIAQLISVFFVNKNFSNSKNQWNYNYPTE